MLQKATNKKISEAKKLFKLNGNGQNNFILIICVYGRVKHVIIMLEDTLIVLHN